MESPNLTGSTRNLILATVAFAVCFAAWGMLAPIAPALQDELGLSTTQTSIMISIPVVLGSLLRIPLGLLTDRIGGRVVFAGMLAYSAGAAVLVGFATFMSGILLRFTPLIFGAVTMWVGAVVCMLLTPDEHVLVQGVATILGYLVPGYWLNHQSRNRHV